METSQLEVPSITTSTQQEMILVEVVDETHKQMKVSLRIKLSDHLLSPHKKKSQGRIERGKLPWKKIV